MVGKMVEIFRVLDEVEFKRKFKRRVYRKKEKKEKKLFRKIEDVVENGDDEENVFVIVVFDVFRFL